MTENTVLDKNTSSIIKKEGIRFRNNNSDFPNLKRLKLGNILLIQRGGSPRPIEDYITDDENGVNWIKIGDAPANGSNRIVSAKEKIKVSGKSKSREVKKGDLILSNSMSFGKPYILEIDGCIHDGWLLLRDTKKEFNLSYLCELLGSPNVLSQYKRLAAGSTVNNLNKDLVASVTVNLPCIEEQKKIADFLLSIDDIISSQEERISTLETYNRGLISQIFKQEIRFKDDNGNDYPDWNFLPITEIATTYIGLVTTMTEHYTSNGIPLIRNSDIKQNKFVFKEPIYLDNEFAEQNKTRQHKIGDIITVHTGDVGTSAIIDQSLNGSIGFATIVTRIKDFSKNSPQYICMYYNSDIYKNIIFNMITGDGRNNLNMKDFNKVKIPIPCLEEQEKIANFLTSLDNVLQEEKNYLEYLKTIKKGLLQQMFV